MAPRSRIVVVAALSALCLLHAGCKKSPEPTAARDGGEAAPSASVSSVPVTAVSAATDGGPEYQEACYAYAKARCAKQSTCSKLAFDLSEGPFPACLSHMTAFCLQEYAPKDGGITPPTITACGKLWEAISCGDLKKTASPKGCEPIAGKLAEGKACTVDAQCATQFCARPGGAACGKCEAAPKAGDDCKDERCGNDASLACVEKKCVKRAPKDGDCAGAGGCDGALACVDEAAGGKKKCVVAGAAGAKCDPTGAGVPCDVSEGLTCDKATSKCKAALVANPGDPCGPASGKLCRGDAICKNNQCVARAKAGGTCDATAACHAPLRCVEGKCKIPELSSCS